MTDTAHLAEHQYLWPEEFTKYVTAVHDSGPSGELWTYWEDGLVVPLRLVEYPEAYVRWCEEVARPAQFTGRDVPVPPRHRKVAGFDRALRDAYQAPSAETPIVLHPLDAVSRTHRGLVRPLRRGSPAPPYSLRSVLITRPAPRQHRKPRLIPIYAPWQVHEIIATRWSRFESWYLPKHAEYRDAVLPRMRIRRNHALLGDRLSQPGDILGLRRDMSALGRWRRASHLARTVLLPYEQRALGGGLFVHGKASIARFEYFLKTEATRIARAGLGRARGVQLARDLASLLAWYERHDFGRAARAARQDLLTATELLLLGHGMSWDQAIDAVGHIPGKRRPVLVDVFEDDRFKLINERAYIFESLVDTSPGASATDFLRALSGVGLLGIANEYSSMQEAWFSYRPGRFEQTQRATRNLLVLSEDTLRWWTRRHLGLLSMKTIEQYGGILKRLERDACWDLARVTVAGLRGRDIVRFDPDTPLTDIVVRLDELAAWSPGGPPHPAPLAPALATGLARNVLAHRWLVDDEHAWLFCRAAANAAIRLVWGLWRLAPGHLVR